MPEPVTISVTALAGTGLGIVVVNKLFDLLLTKWRSDGPTTVFNRNDQNTLQSLGNAHLVNARDAKGRFYWWGMETTEAVRENTGVQREILAELKKQNGSRTL